MLYGNNLNVNDSYVDDYNNLINDILSLLGFSQEDLQKNEFYLKELELRGYGYDSLVEFLIDYYSKVNLDFLEFCYNTLRGNEHKEGLKKLKEHLESLSEESLSLLSKTSDSVSKIIGE